MFQKIQIRIKYCILLIPKNSNPYTNNQKNIYLNTIPTSTQRTNNLIQLKLNKENKNVKNSKPEIIISNQNKERPRSSQKIKIISKQNQILINQI